MTAPKLVEHFFRHEYARLVAVMVRRSGVQHLAAIEDAVQSALMRALEVWKVTGTPDNPSGWLFRVAQNAFVSELRKRASRHQLIEQIAVENADSPQEGLEHFRGEMQDDLLRMLFVCCDEQEGQHVVCDGTFSQALDGKYVRLDAHWLLADGKSYDEICLFNALPDGGLGFWSFTSDGKRSEGWRSGAPDVHAEALCFEADMDAGRARQVYWPGEDGTMHWAVESATRKGRRRFTDHVYAHRAN